MKNIFYTVGFVAIALWLIQEYIMITSEPPVHVCDGGMEEDIDGVS